MSPSSKKTDVIIAGAGIPGATLALLLAQLDLSVTLIDPAPLKADDKIPDTRTAALMAGSVNILRATGAWESCAAQGGIMKSIALIDKDARVDFKSSDIGQDFFSINMPNNVLRAALLEKIAKDKRISFLAPAKLTGLKADDVGTTAALDNDANIRASLTVGADGRGSAVRSLSGIAHKEHDYGQHAITCLIDHTKGHDNISTEYHRPGGPFTLVPLPGNRSSVVWVEYAKDAEKFMRLPKDAFEQSLQDRTEGILGRITLVAGPQSFPLKHLQAEHIIATRTALIAEAAHVLHPLGAQGLNLSLRDAAVLAETIADMLRLGMDIGGGQTLEIYAKRRKGDIAFRAGGTDTLNRLISTSSPAAGFLRRAGLKTLDSITVLRDMVVREGMSPRNDNSRLLNGQAL